jgi:hypothetical protein
VCGRDRIVEPSGRQRLERSGKVAAPRPQSGRSVEPEVADVMNRVADARNRSVLM